MKIITTCGELKVQKGNIEITQSLYLQEAAVTAGLRGTKGMSWGYQNLGP